MKILYSGMRASSSVDQVSKELCCYAQSPNVAAKSRGKNFKTCKNGASNKNYFSVK